MISFDTPEPLELIQDLRDYAFKRGYHNTSIERRPTNQSRNLALAENFKALINDARVHAPEHALALAELLNLEMIGDRVDHPAIGPVTTKDVADAMFEVTYWLTDSNNRVAQRLAETGLGAAWPGGIIPGGSPSPIHEALSNWSSNARRYRPSPDRGGRFRQGRGGYQRRW